jgi:hypothetical protein
MHSMETWCLIGVVVPIGAVQKGCREDEHQVETCQLPRCCLCCHGFCHLARDYKRLKHAVTSTAKGSDRPCHSARGSRPLASQQAPHGGPPSSDGAVRVPQGMPVEPDDDHSDAEVSRRGSSTWSCLPTTTTMALPLLLHSTSLSQICWHWSCARASGPPAWVDSMLEELATLLVVSHQAGAPAPGCSHAPAAASQEVDVSLVDAYSPTKTTQWTMDSPPLLPVQGPPQVTLPWGTARCHGCRGPPLSSTG